MKQLTSQAIVLRRTDYGEADRILTLLTPEYGKLSLLAKGVRRIKSKLAGGIELFSVSQLVFIRGRSDLGTLISSRLEVHYGTIVKDIERTMLGYELIKQLNRATEDSPEPEYFSLMRQAFEALDDQSIPLTLIQMWFSMQLLRLGGHTPNLQTDTAGDRLNAEQTYHFSFDDMTFAPHTEGSFTANHIKFLRLGFAGHSSKTLYRVRSSQELTAATAPLLQTMRTTYLRV